MNIIRWCNENNGFLTAILSLIGLVLSVTAIVVSIRTARLPYKKKLMLPLTITPAPPIPSKAWRQSAFHLPAFSTQVRRMGKKGCSSGCGNICATASTQEITTVADGRFFKSKDMKTLSADGVSAKTVKIKNASCWKTSRESMAPIPQLTGENNCTAPCTDICTGCCAILSVEQK